MEDEGVCPICKFDINPNDPENPGVTLGKKGIITLLNACQARKKETLSQFIKSRRDSSGKIVLHVICRKGFTDLRNVEDDKNEQPPAKKTRSSSDAFVWAKDC